MYFRYSPCAWETSYLVFTAFLHVKQDLQGQTCSSDIFDACLLSHLAQVRSVIAHKIVRIYLNRAVERQPQPLHLGLSEPQQTSSISLLIDSNSPTRLKAGCRDSTISVCRH